MGKKRRRGEEKKGRRGGDKEGMSKGGERKKEQGDREDRGKESSTQPITCQQLIKTNSTQNNPRKLKILSTWTV